MKIYLKEIRQKRKLTLIRLSTLTGISKTHLNDIETGKKSPTIEILCKISIVLQVNITDLFECE